MKKATWEIRSEKGVLWVGDEVIDAVTADRIAATNGFVWAERIVLEYADKGPFEIDANTFLIVKE